MNWQKLRDIHATFWRALNMTYKSIRTALLLSAVAMAVSGGCGGGGGGGFGGFFGGGDEFFVQTWSEAAPNTHLAQFFDEGDNGDKISLTQHTGSMILSGDAVFNLIEGEGALVGTIEATADAADDNPMHLTLDDALEFPKVRIASVGTFGVFEVELADEGTPDETIDVLGAKTNFLDVGDDVLALSATSPGVYEVNGDPLDYMSMVGWIAIKLPDPDATSLALEFGFGHLGLVTPEDDMPVEGEAFYAGIFEGIYVEPGEETGFGGDAIGVAEFTADFGDASVVGGVSAISVVGSDAGGNIDFAEVVISGNTFSGNVVPGAGGFAEFDPESTGAVDGTFYGPVNEALNGPEEAGAVLTLQDAGSGAFITGVIGANVAGD
jgi:hypothetical protein